MLKLVSLIAIAAAAETEAEEKSKAEKHLAEGKAKLAKSLKTKDSKIGTLFTMPSNAVKAPTFAELVAPNSDFCNECVFAGGEWSTKDKQCALPAAKLAELKKAGKAGDLEGTDVPATVDAGLTYGAMFTGIDGCNAWVTDKATQEAAYKLVKFTHSTSKVVSEAKTFDDAATAKGVEATVQSTGAIATTFDAKKFDLDKTNSFKVDWDTTTDSWGAARIVMPTTFAGGMYMSMVNDTNTNVAVCVDGTINRFFDGASAAASNVGKTDKFPLMSADALEFVMQKKSTWTDALNKAKPFSVTYTRASYKDIAIFTAKNGGAVVWIIVGVLVVALCCAVGVLYKFGKCCFGKKTEDSDTFYAVEDCYARV